jgi:alpha-L-arabinofuranosidase
MKNIVRTLAIAMAFPVAGMAQSTLKLNPEKASVKISKEIYGHFSEHLGTCIYGGIYVGENSKIPNIKGYRTDVVNAMKEVKIPVLRWPGGCFADTYHWKDGIGPKENRPSIVNVHWGGVTEDNSFGTHEFLDFCELIGTEPYLSINVGTGTVQEAAEWVEYVTSSNESPMTDLRKKNGREDPWNVKFWGIGNETWGCGGDMRPEYYADVYRHYASFVRGNDLQRIAVGPSSDDYNWTRKFMEGMKGKNHMVQGLSLHHYTLPTGSWTGSKGSSTDFGEDQWMSTMRRTYQVDELIRKHVAIMDEYDPQKKVYLAVDEWGTWYDKLPGTKEGFLQQQNTLRDALVAGINLNIFNNHADRVKMGNIAQIVNVLQAIILTNEEKMVLTPTYHVFKMFNVHQDATLVPSELKTGEYVFGNESIPLMTASASVSNGAMNVTLTNASPSKDEPLTIELPSTYKTATAQIITAKNMNDLNDFGKEEKVKIETYKVEKPSNGKLTLNVPAKSVILVQFK